MPDTDKESIEESQRVRVQEITHEPSEDGNGDARNVRSETDDRLVSVTLGDSSQDISIENPNAGDVRAFLRYKASEIWSHSQVKVRSLADVPVPYVLEVMS